MSNKTPFFNRFVFPSMFISFLIFGCNKGKPKELTEFTNRTQFENEIGKEITRGVNEIGAELPDGKRVYLRKFNYSGAIPSESTKKITIFDPTGKEYSLEFGQTHSGYGEVELRCNKSYTRFWVIDVSKGSRHMYSGAAIDLTTGAEFGEQINDWSASWARPNNGLLILRSQF